MTEHGEPPTYVKWLIWVFQKKTWKDSPIPATITLLALAASTFLAINNFFSSEPIIPPRRTGIEEIHSSYAQQATANSGGMVTMTLSQYGAIQKVHAKEIQDFADKRNREVDELKKALEASESQIKHLVGSISSYKKRASHFETRQKNSNQSREAEMKVFFPLNGFLGKRVMAELWDDSAQTHTLFKEFVGPGELVIEDVKPNHWYWLKIKEYDEKTGDWISVHSTWFSG